MEKVLSIKVKRGGTQGATVVFTKNEVKSQVSWKNTVTKNYAWPVQGAFRDKIEKIGPLVAKILDLKQTDEPFVGLGFDLKPIGYVLSASKLYYSGQSKVFGTPFNTYPVGPEDQYFNEIDEIVQELIAMLKTYCSTEAQVDRKQLIMDLKEAGKIKLPEELENVSIEDIEDPAILEKFKLALEKRGCFIMGGEEVEEEEGFSEEMRKVS